jgi:hypothetical protein
MKTIIPNKLILCFLLIVSSNFLYAQEALKYLNEMSKAQNDISKDYMSYISAASHGKSARKVEKRRSSLIETVLDAKKEAIKIQPYHGDRVLKDALVNYLGILYNILNEDYGKIVNMEDIAEQSYDNMEAYFMAQDLATKKQDEAYKKFDIAYDAFAKKYDIKIIKKEDELSLKLKKANAVNDYYHKIYLIFFKSFKQDLYLVNALEKNDLSGIEQNKNTLLKFSNEALLKLDTTKALMGDKSLVVACAEIMKFFKEETGKIKIFTDFLVQKESFDKMEKAFKAKSAKQRTQADVDGYNKQVELLNKMSNTFNTTNQELNNNRTKFIKRWNDNVSKFLDTYIPTYK